MSLLSTLARLFPAVMARKLLIAAVGGGGKTGTLFALARGFSAAGFDVTLTTTTHIRDPRHEAGRHFNKVIVDSSLALPRLENIGLPPALLDQTSHDTGRSGRITIVASAIENEALGPRLIGIHPGRARDLLDLWDLVLVEADGSRMLPVKAPASHEPVMPAGVDLVLGLIGLDCLGRPMDFSTVHRPELFSALTGCSPGQPIRAAHLRALATSPLGLFKGAPPEALRILVLNKADMMDNAARASIEQCFTAGMMIGLDAVLLYCALLDEARCLTGPCYSV